MSGLSEGGVYEYKIENRSDVFNFTFRHAHQPGRVTKHIIFGDMGSAHAYSLCLACTGDVVCNSSTCATNNTDVGLIAETDADMFLHLGDFACTLQRLQALFILEQTLNSDRRPCRFVFICIICVHVARFTSAFCLSGREQTRSTATEGLVFFVFVLQLGEGIRHYECSSL
jgi:hypothetical protein